MGRVGRREHSRSRRDTLLGQAVMHVNGRQQAEAGMMVLSVVPGEEALAVRSGVLNRAEPLREVRAVLQRLELRLRERVVVGDVGAAMRPRDPQVLNLRAQKWWLPKLQRSLTACDDLDCRAQW